MVVKSPEIVSEKRITEGRTISWPRLYDWLASVLYPGNGNRLQESILDLLPDSLTVNDVLDIGCGTGELLLLARKKFPGTVSLVGVDASAKMIERARKKSAERKAGVEFKQAPAEDLPLEDSSFDLLFSTLMIHHLPEPLVPASLQQMHRVLRRDGRVLIVDIQSRSGSILEKLKDSLILLHGGHKRYQDSMETLALQMHQNGFELESKGSVDRQLSYLIARKSIS